MERGCKSVKAATNKQHQKHTMSYKRTGNASVERSEGGRREGEK
jgi:hypothetical protein